MPTCPFPPRRLSSRAVPCYHPPTLVFATDYPQAVRDGDEVAGYVDAMRALGTKARSVLEGANAEKLIPNLRERWKERTASRTWLRRSRFRTTATCWNQAA